MTLQDILASTDERKARWGIKRASAYVNSFSGCLSGGACPSSLLGVSGDQWAKCLKEAEELAVYANPSLIVKDFTESDLPEGAILGFDFVLTSTRKDRDGDTLESSGAILDVKMPGLWQHLPLQPVGKLVKELSRSKRNVMCRGAIADIPLGRDAAILTKFGALRISHGFMPIEFEPLYNEKDQREGWHIKRFEVFEWSLVSVPSNIDAVVLSSTEKSKSFAQELDGIRTAFSRGLLKTDAVKQWAKHFHENRPAIGKGVELPASSIETVASLTYVGPDGEVLATEKHPLNIKVSFDQAIETFEKLSDCVKEHSCTCRNSDVPVRKDADAAKEGGADRDHCKCPKCGYSGPGDEFMPDGTDEAKSVSVEQKFFAEILNDPTRMRMVRDRLNTMLDAQSVGDELEAILSVLG